MDKVQVQAIQHRDIYIVTSLRSQILEKRL